MLPSSNNDGRIRPNVGQACPKATKNWIKSANVGRVLPTSDQIRPDKHHSDLQLSTTKPSPSNMRTFTRKAGPPGYGGQSHSRLRRCGETTRAQAKAGLLPQPLQGPRNADTYTDTGQGLPRSANIGINVPPTGTRTRKVGGFGLLWRAILLHLVLL